MLVIVIILLGIGIYLIYENTKEKVDTGANISSEEELCRLQGGTWQQFSDACADTCASERDGLMCAQVLTNSCECGPTECWTGTACEPI